MKLEIKETQHPGLTPVKDSWQRIETPLAGATAVLVFVPLASAWNAPLFLFQVNNRNVHFTIPNPNADPYISYIKLCDIRDIYEQGMIPEDTYRWACSMVVEDML